MAASTSAAAASTSTAADSNNSTCYDVFISHRGPDVKKTFASHLYGRLISCGLRVFLDYKELQEGKYFPCQIKSAISAASLHVAIFSPTYADSEWCLDELVLMLESGTPIIPVFHHVKPTDLRRTRGFGVYATSLSNLQNKINWDSQLRYDAETIEDWRNALSKVADISGFDLEALKGDEGELVDKIVKDVLKRVKTPLNVARYPTGLQEKVQDFEEEVLFQQLNGGVQVVGITGLGGMGKTTLAIELFNRKSSEYDKSYFLFDVRENAQKSSLHSLQRKLLNGLLQLDLPIDDWRDGIEKLKKYLSPCNFLLVLDDVDRPDQVSALLPQLDVLGHDSLILITSRDKDVLTRSGVQESSIYQLSGLNTQRSRELFCSHAFGQSHPLLGFEHLVNKFLTACNGLPLSLKVLGGLLYGNTDKSYWESELEEVRKALPQDIQSILQISYDALKEEEQKIFLDIACFFVGIDRDSAITVWEGSGWNGKRGFQSLLNKCLVEVYTENNEQRVNMRLHQCLTDDVGRHFIRMHDHLRDMGRDLANRSGFPYRLWCGTKHMEDLLQQSSEATRVRGIRMSDREYYDQRAYSDEDDDERPSFSGYKMKNLQILDIDHIDDDLLKCLLEGVDSPNLLWFRWRDRGRHLRSLPPSIPMKKLRVLDVDAHVLETLWQEDLQPPLQLRELWITSSPDVPIEWWYSSDDDRFLTLHRSFKIPKSIGQLKHLERMVVISWSDAEIPKEFCYLSALKHLVLRFKYLSSSLPDSFGNLSSLEHFEMSGCRSMLTLPDSFGELAKLECINLSNCCDLRTLPDSFGNLSRLQHINLSYCSLLTRLPDSFGNLSSLQHINLSHCRLLLKTLPDSFGNLSSLQHINLSHCDKLTTLPDSFGDSTRLQHINLSYCDRLTTLPDSFGNLSMLEYINLRHCSRLSRLPDSFGDLWRLERINLSECSALEMLPDTIGNLSSIRDIDLSNCHALERLPDSFGKLSMLEYISLQNCALKRLPETFGNLSMLEDINLCACRRLKKLPASFGNLSMLKYIDLSHCLWGWRRLPESFGNLSMLEWINMDYCRGLKRLPDSFGNLSSLKRISMRECYRFERFPESFGNLSMLEHINMDECRCLKRLPNSFGNLSRLTWISMTHCYSFERLPDSFGNLINLKYLNLVGCDMLTIPSGTFGKITLEKMYLGRQWGIKVFPAFFPAQIAPHWSEDELLLWLINLTEWPSAIGEACDLEGLVLRTPFLEALPPSFGRDLRNLKFLELQGCRSLKRLPDSFLLLNQLVDLRVEDCSPELPPSSGRDLRNLKFLELRDCKSFPDSILLLNQLIHLRMECCSLDLLPPSFGRDLRNLKFLELRSCNSLKRLPDSFLLLDQLIDLTVEHCSPELHFKAVEGENETLTDSGGERTSSNLERCLLRLQHLTLRNTHISEVSFPTCVFPDLQYVDISNCPDLVEVTLPNALRTLTLYNCSKLRKIGAPFPTGACANLQDLHIMKCDDVESNKPFWKSFYSKVPWCVMTSQNGLEIKVEISNFSKLRKIGGSFPTGVCPNFQELSIQHCENLVELEILPTALQHLNIRKCEELVEVDCPNLQPLEIWPVDCQELVEVGTLSNALVKLQLIDCPKIERLCGLTQPAQRSGGRSREYFPKI